MLADLLNSITPQIAEEIGMAIGFAITVWFSVRVSLIAYRIFREVIK